MDFATTIKKLGIEQMMNYLYKDPDKNLLKLMDWADRFAKGSFEPQRKTIRAAISDPNSTYYPYVKRLMHDVDPSCSRE